MPWPARLPSSNRNSRVPLRFELSGELNGPLVGEATTAGRATALFEVRTDRHGRTERFYECGDEESGIVLKLLSYDRDWAFGHERFRLPPQPDYYFEAPSG